MWSVRGAEPLTVWSAVPPTQDFVALGAVATPGGPEQPPQFDAIRCVRREWVFPSKGQTDGAALVWDTPDGRVWRSGLGLMLGAKPKQPAPPAHEVLSGELRASASKP